jgi:hypothetical protein
MKGKRSRETRVQSREPIQKTQKNEGEKEREGTLIYADYH